MRALAHTPKEGSTMKRLLLVLVLAALFAGVIPGVAQAAPQFGYRWTAAHGWIVWANNDRYYPIRTTCHWYAGGYWHFTWRLRPSGYGWTTSDAGSWGNRKPQNLRCSYARAY